MEGGPRVNILVYGAGAIGGVVGARLAETGCHVALVARGEHLATMRRDGLTIEDLDGVRHVHLPIIDSSPGSAQKELSQALAADTETVVVLAVKSQHTVEALATLRQMVSPKTPVVCAQNGIDNERQAARFFENVYGACVSCMASHVRPGEVRAHSGPLLGSIDVGRYPTGIDRVTDELTAHLRVAGFDSQATSDIMCWKREKLLVNLGTIVEAICGPGKLRNRIVDAVRTEGRAALAAAELTLPSPQASAQRAKAKTEVVIPRAGGSAWQSLRRRTGNVESDYINGEIALLGRLYGVATPANQLVQQIAAELAEKGADPASTPEPELVRRLEEALN